MAAVQNKRYILFTIATLRFAEKYQSKKMEEPVLKQVIRSSGSIGANITEAYGSGSKKDFAHFFQIALKSAKETKYWFEVLAELHPNDSACIELLKESEEIIKILTKSIQTLRK